MGTVEIALFFIAALFTFIAADTYRLVRERAVHFRCDKCGNRMIKGSENHLICSACRWVRHP